MWGIRVQLESHTERANRVASNMTQPTQRNAVTEVIVASKSWASRRFRLIPAKNRSTTHRRGSTWNPT